MILISDNGVRKAVKSSYHIENDFGWARAIYDNFNRLVVDNVYKSIDNN